MKLSSAKMFMNFIDRKLGHYSDGSFGSICKNLTYCVGKHCIWAML